MNKSSVNESSAKQDQRSIPIAKRAEPIRPLRQLGPIRHWLALLVLTDLSFIFLIWIVRPEALKSISLFILLFTAAITLAGFLLERRRQQNIARAMERFLESPGEAGKEALIRAAGTGQRREAELLFAKLSQQAEQMNEAAMNLAAYREYIEAWVHEVKTPLSLSALVLCNHKNEMSPYVYGRMRYVQHQLADQAERILYYARLQADHSDIKYETLRLDLCTEEVLSQYRALAEERQTAIRLALSPICVVSDRRITDFILSQLLSNAIKYADPGEPEVSVHLWQEEDTIFLAIRNNGRGIPPEDAPFIFDKGFTGNHPDRQKATGMGLYLAKQYAQKLGAKMELEPICTTGTGFGIRVLFKL